MFASAANSVPIGRRCGPSPSAANRARHLEEEADQSVWRSTPATATRTSSGKTSSGSADVPHFDPGSLTSSSDGRTVAYAAFGKATSIARDGHASAFAHGPDRSRFRRTDTDPQGNATTTLYLGSVEKVTRPDGDTLVRRRIGGTAIEIEGPAAGSCGADAVRYVLRDHLGSVDRLTDGSGAEAQSMSFGAWGARRSPDDWAELAKEAAAAFDACATNRGFTGHEMLDAAGAVHMNGRLYDPALGRFLRADPFVQFPANLQNHNRYSYVLNNPLSLTDPSGHFVLSLATTLIVAAANPGFTATVAALAAAGAGDALIQGASFQQALQAGFISGVSAAAFSAIGSGLGANFDGSFAGGLTALGSGLNNSRFIGGLGFSPLRVAIGAAVGGTASRITGGKFANGAVTGAFSQALNNERAKARAADERDRRTKFQNALDRLKQDGTLDPNRNHDTPDDAAKEVLNATAPLSEEYGLEAGGSIYETADRKFRYTFPTIGEATRMRLSIEYRGYHTHPGGSFKFSNSHSRASEAYDLMWVDKARKDLYLGTVNPAGAVRVGVCEPLKCFDYGRDGTDPNKIVQ